MAASGAGAALADDQGVGAAAVGAEDERAQRRFRRGLDERGRRPVAEDRPQRAVGRVDVLRVGFRGNQQHPPGRAAVDQAVGQRQPVDEARTTQVEIQRPDRGGQPQPLLHQAGGGGQGVVGRLRAEEQEVDRLAIDLVLGEEPLGGLHAQIGGALAGRGPVAGADARLCVDQVHVPAGMLGLEKLIGLDRLGQINRDRANGRVLHRRSLPGVGWAWPTKKHRWAMPTLPFFVVAHQQPL